ncbi:MAG: hypothetical protein HQK52_22030 [Oligoflexia bacterium]|nr:hypothetical protein [Oligoflexia bacterium]
MRLLLLLFLFMAIAWSSLMISSTAFAITGKTVVIRDLGNWDKIFVALKAQKPIAKIILVPTDSTAAAITNPMIMQALEQSDVEIIRCQDTTDFIPSKPDSNVNNFNVIVACRELTTAEQFPNPANFPKLFYVQGKAAGSSAEETIEMNKGTKKIVQDKSIVVVSEAGAIQFLKLNETKDALDVVTPTPNNKKVNVDFPGVAVATANNLSTTSIEVKNFKFPNKKFPKKDGAESAVTVEYPAIEIYEKVTSQNEEEFLKKLEESQKKSVIMISGQQIFAETGEGNGHNVKTTKNGVTEVEEYVCDPDNLDKTIEVLAGNLNKKIILVDNDPLVNIILLGSLKFLVETEKKQYTSIANICSELSPKIISISADQCTQLFNASVGKILKRKREEKQIKIPEEEIEVRALDKEKAGAWLDMAKNICEKMEKDHDRNKDEYKERYEHLQEAVDNVMAFIKDEGESNNKKVCMNISTHGGAKIVLEAGQMWGRKSKDAEVLSFIENIKEEDKKYISRFHLLVKQDVNGDLFLDDFSHNKTAIFKLNQEGEIEYIKDDEADEKDKEGRFQNKKVMLPKNGGFVLGNQKILCQDVSGDEEQAIEKLKTQIRKFTNKEKAKKKAEEKKEKEKEKKDKERE